CLPHRCPPSFPTRRSSDLVRCGAYICIGSGRYWIVDEFGAIRSVFGGGIDGIVLLNPPAVSSSGIVAAAFVKDQQALLGRLLLRSEEHTSELQSRENLVCR